MEQRTATNPKKHSTAIRRNEALHTDLYEKIAALNAVNYAVQPTLYTHWRSLVPQLMSINLGGERKRGSKADNFECEVALAYRRNYLETNELYTVHGNNRIVELRPAMGELRRSPTRFVAIVLINNNHKAFRTVAIEAGQLLTVVL